MEDTSQKVTNDDDSEWDEEEDGGDRLIVWV